MADSFENESEDSAGESISVDKQPSTKSCLLVATGIVVLVCILAAFSAMKDMRTDNQYLNPGLASYRAGDCKTAEKDLSRYLQETGHDNAYVEYDLGMCYYRDGDSQKALGCFLKDRYNIGTRNHIAFKSLGVHIRNRSAVMIERITGKRPLY